MLTKTHPCHAPHTGTAYLAAGFTLLELLVVLVLIGIILSFAMLSIGDGGRQDKLEREARRLQALITLAGEEAVLQSRVIGLLLEPPSYRFMHHSMDGWQLLEDPVFRSYRLPESMQLQLYQSNNRVGLANFSSNSEQGANPQILFQPSSERSSFELQISYQDSPPLSYTLTSPMLGKVSLSLDPRNSR